MAKYEAVITSGWPAAETFSYLATFSNAAHWDPGVLSGEQIDPGAVRLGTRFRLTVPFLGRRLALIYQVTHLAAGREVTLAAVSRLLRATDRITVEDLGDHAVVSYEARVQLRAVLALLDPLLRRGFQRVGSRAAAGLSAVLAAPEDSPGPAA